MTLPNPYEERRVLSDERENIRERLTQRFRFTSPLALMAAVSSAVVPSEVVGQEQGFEVQEIQTLLDRYEGALNASDVDAVIGVEEARAVRPRHLAYRLQGGSSSARCWR